jgi:nucleotide-binding universal stress UspA family protein
MEYPSALPLETPEDRERAAKSVIDFVRGIAGEVTVPVLVRDGAVVPEILRTAMELPADLIVMGTHGLSGFERLLLGSVTEKVLRKAPCPVLTVPRQVGDAEPHVTFKTIVCGVDFSGASNRAFEVALSLAEEAGGRLALLHVLESLPEEDSPYYARFNVPEFRSALEQDARSQLGRLVPEEARAWCEPDEVLRYGRAYREILAVAADRHADLIVLGAQGRGAVDRALFGSTAQHVVRGAACPVLTVPPLRVPTAAVDEALQAVPAAQ